MHRSDAGKVVSGRYSPFTCSVLIWTARDSRRAHNTVGVFSDAMAATVVPHDPAPITLTLITIATQRTPSTLLSVECAVLVPMKSFDDAKARLSGVLSPHLRGMFARWMADQVFNSARPLPIYVVCDNEEVAHFADTRACTVLWKPGHGLNSAVQSDRKSTRLNSSHRT